MQCSQYLATFLLTGSLFSCFWRSHQAEQTFCQAACISECLGSRSEFDACKKSCPQLKECVDLTPSDKFAVKNITYAQQEPGIIDFSWETIAYDENILETVLFVINYREHHLDPWRQQAEVLLRQNVTLVKAHNCTRYYVQVVPVFANQMGNSSEIEVPEPKLPFIKLNVGTTEMISMTEFVVHLNYTVPNGWHKAISDLEIRPLDISDFCKEPLKVGQIDFDAQTFSASTSSRNCKQFLVVDGYRMCKQSYRYSGDPVMVDIKCRDFDRCQHPCEQTHLCKLAYTWKNLTEDDACASSANLTVSWSDLTKTDPALEIYRNCKTKLFALQFTQRDPHLKSKSAATVLYQGRLDVLSERSITLNNVPLDSIVRLAGCEIFETATEDYLHSKLREDIAIATYQDVNLYKMVDDELCAHRAAENKKTNLAVIIVPLLLALAILIGSLVLICRKNRKERIKLKQIQATFIDRYHNMMAPDTGDTYELDPRYLQIFEDEVLGRGAFGKVYKGKVLARLIHSKSSLAVDQDNSDKVFVAVKVCHEIADEATKQDFRQEIELMKQLHYHPTLVNILHCITRVEPLSLVLEYCANGDLLKFLRHTIRAYMNDIKQEGIDPTTEGVDHGKTMTYKDVISIAFQVADGMEYISAKGYIHRDLAARNVLVCESISKVKIGDFGLCRQTEADAYMTKGGKLPIKWLALESLESWEFTSATDVWSFAIFLYEVLTLGGSPYPDIIPEGDMRETMLHYLSSGARMVKPSNCSDELYNILTEMWDSKPEARPKFSDLKERFRTMLADLVGNELGEYGDYYIVPSSSIYHDVRTDTLDEKEMVEVVDVAGFHISESESHFDTASGKEIIQNETHEMENAV